MHSKIVKMIAEGLQSRRYLELGVKNGDTFNVVAPIVEQAYAVDISEKSYEKIKHNENSFWFHMSTDEFIKNNDRYFDLVFIDACHSHEQSLKDFLGISSFVNDNGLILLHDTYPRNTNMLQFDRCGEVYRTAWYIRQNMRENFEIVTLPFYHGISIVRKCNKQLDWKDD